MTSRIETEEPAATAGAAAPPIWTNEEVRVLTGYLGEKTAEAFSTEVARLRRIEAAARAWSIARDRWAEEINERSRNALVKAGDVLAAALTSSTPEKP